MLITLEQMQQLHAIQLEMFRELLRVMDELNVRYYFVHGSLLSAVTTHQFIAEDDDVDIAVFREDYERLMDKGNEIVSSQYFIQCSLNDDFPLPFAKMRKKNTEFFQPVLGMCNCDKGIYIDIFPIDFVPEKEGIIFKAKNFFLKKRINGRLNMKRNIKQKSLLLFSKILYPSYALAIRKREALYASFSDSKYVAIWGGKATEQKLLNCWFGEGKLAKFCGLEVNCPENSAAYLEKIYGKNYLEKNPAEDRITTDNMIEVSASYIDFGDGKHIGVKTVDET